ncbi:PucR family transcriptional regulator [Paenibacillus sp. CH40]|uniref:PucR family transcriptional regulator n=1 Tax=Paenibacillus sp. CH40 TaxID=2962045 RepID=UPI0020B68DF6|nr:PucR family transcriptional regulator [Paenibacillus sp. CH40]MCP3795825.1 PucR family transcriptional regulator ligand-binding domain-containing protein [Paenibacillus sp. CH40]
MNGKKTFTIADVLERPVFRRAKLAAGEQGVHRLVGWVHVLEITNVSPFVSRHDLILTTGLWLTRKGEERAEYMEQLIRSEAAGLCVELGTSIHEIPSEILELAERQHFPVIVFEQPVRFVEITQDIHSLLINRHHELLKDLERFSRQLQQETLRSTDMNALLRVLHDYAARQVIYMSSIETNRFVPSVQPDLADRIAGFYANEVESSMTADREGHLLFHLNESTAVLFQPVVCFGQVFSAVGLVLHSEMPTEEMSLLLDYTAKAAATLVLRTQFLEDRLLRNQNELIQDVLSGQLPSEEQAQTRMGLRLLSKGQYLFWAGVIEVEHQDKDASQVRKESINQDVLVLLRSLLKKETLHNLLMMKGSQCYILCAKEELTLRSAAQMKKVLAHTVQYIQNYAAGQLDKVRIHAGFGKVRHRMTGTDRSFEEAYEVIEVARSVPVMKDRLFYDSIGIYQLLKAVPRIPFLQEFVEDHLGELIAHDREHHMQLLDTLDAYFQSHGSKRDTAGILYIHRQTLYNRLDKINEIIEGNLADPDKRRCLEMALLAYRMLQAEN